MGGVKRTTEYYSDLCKSKDAILLEDWSDDGKRWLKIKCNKDENVWIVSPNSINNGQWCKECWKRENWIDTNDVVNLITSRGYKILSSGPFGRETKVKVVCEKHGIIWYTSYDYLRYTKKPGKNPGDCILCGKNYPSLNEISNLINSKDGTFLGRVNDQFVKRNLKVKCNKHNHIWDTTWHSLKIGEWCYHCGNESRRYSYNEVYEFIKERGGTLLDKTITTSDQKINIACDCGNVFKVSIYNLMKEGRWCKLCDGANSKQKDLYKILLELYPYEYSEYNYWGIDWLRMNNKSNKHLQIDIWFPFLMLAIEYDGEQHFKPVRFGGISLKRAEENLKLNQSRDIVKNKLISEHYNEVKYFIRFNYKEDITRENVIKKLQDNNVPIKLFELESSMPYLCFIPLQFQT